MINFSRGTLGWVLKKARELDEEIKIWSITFDDYKIPSEHLPELWKRARDLRISRLNNGKECPDFTAELLAACWTGENGLRAEILRREVEAKRTLPETAESQCPRCYGLGMEYVFGENGKSLGCRRNCRHEPLKVGEWLWKQAQKAEESEGF